MAGKSESRHVSVGATIKMSGPIVRKYGFPNFDKIFGERPLEHGVDEGNESADQPAEASAAASPKKASTKKKSPKSKKE
jgi:hypothetical protein